MMIDIRQLISLLLYNCQMSIILVLQDEECPLIYSMHTMGQYVAP